MKNLTSIKLPQVSGLKRDHPDGPAVASHELHLQLSSLAAHVYDRADISSLKPMFWQAVYQHDDVMFSGYHQWAPQLDMR
jgi:hypothetical protein